MNAYLTRLGIRPELQKWLAPYYYTNGAGHLCFSYGEDTETYGLAFHSVPTRGRWMTENPLARQVILCSSAMEAIAWLNLHPANLDHLLIVATNAFTALPKGKYTLVFGSDLIGHCYDLKAAAALTGHPVSITIENDTVHIDFRCQHFKLPAETFSLSAFERLSGYRFSHIKTSKPSRHSSWLNQLINYGYD